MTANKRPEPLVNTSAKKGKICPVCGFASYSREGVHPQCSRQRADEKRTAKIKSQKSSEEKPKASSANAVKPWHKVCPKCKLQVHVRRASCDCGYTFPTNSTTGVL